MTKSKAIKTVRENTTALIGCPEYGYKYNTYDESMNAWREGSFTAGYSCAQWARSQHMINRANELINGEDVPTEYRGGSWVDYVG